jgi:hypothetical protein
MNIDLHEILKSAIKAALTEWTKENSHLLEGIHSKTENGSNVLTVKQFCAKHPFITEGGMRHKLNLRQWNGLDKCIANGTRRILIKEKEMLDWFENPPPNADWAYDENKYPKKDDKWKKYLPK